MPSLVTIVVGLFFTGAGLYFLVNPMLQGARDAKFIESEEVGPAEKLGGCIIGFILLCGGLAFVYLGLL